MEQVQENIKENDSENSSQEPVDLIEMVRAKHSDEDMNKESIIDIFTMQLIMCVLLILIFAVLNLIEAETAGWFISEFKSVTSGNPEKFLKQAVKYAVQYIK
ncbi:hypothetical protein [Porcipelethomonas sp.]|uniref:hypothetical protein n=1 Tax=Porcipelethomonas sp. TaxID=2981675 RepID=UPI003EF22E47